MKNQFLYEKTKFMALAGIRTRARFNQIITGFISKKGGKEYPIKPLLIENEDYKYMPCCECGKSTIYFTQTALDKVLANKKPPK